MKKYLLFILFSQLSFVFAQTNPTIRVVLDINKIKFSLKNVAKESDVVGKNIATLTTLPQISLPMLNGTEKIFRIVESPIWEDKAALEKSDIRTYSGVSNDNDGTTTRFSITPLGFSAIIRTPTAYYIIEAVDVINNVYEVYPITNKGGGKCDVDESHPIGQEIIKDLPNQRIKSSSPFPNGSQLRVYRMAAAATGEFTTNIGSGDQATAVAKITQIVNLIGAIYEAEASMRFSLIAATTTAPYPIIFTTAASDPFTPDPNFASANASEAGFDLMALNTGSFANVLPYNTYDVGHTFSFKSTTYVSGQAGPTPCTDGFKARGWTEMNASAASSGIGSVVNIAAHEIAHQFSVSHGYNAVGGSSGSPTFCTNGWSSAGAIEPGGGSTLMGYNSNCQIPNYTLTGSNLDSYFHTKSLEQMFLGAGFTAVNGTTCGSFTPTTNNIPVANAGSNYTIPKGTPFTLTGSATDADNDVLTYQWDEFDVATANDKGAFGGSINGTGGYTAVNSTASAPLFRSKQQTTPVRTFPQLANILNNANNPADNEGEDLPQAARTMKFRLTVLDNKANGGGVDSDETIITVANVGPFLLTSQNSSTLWIYNGTNTATITWSVNGTTAAPLSVTNVKISLSTDGGNTFPTVLAASTPNDGSHIITIPNNISSQVRIKIEPLGSHIFFDINDINITITNTCTPETTNITPSTALNAIVGDPSLNLGLAGYGSSISSFTGTLSTSSSAGNLSFENPSGVCAGPSNSNYYAVHAFQIITSGTYTFTKTVSNSLVMNLYSAAYNPSSVCSNWLASSGKQNAINGPVTTNTSFSKALTPGTYYIVVETFSSNTNPVLPINYTINLSGGTIYNIAPQTGSPYAYTFLVKNNTSGNIVDFPTIADLTNTTTYPVGGYTVYGLSYQGGANLSPYIGTSFSSFQSLLIAGTVCGKLSDNSKVVTITPNCSNTLALSGTAVAGTQQANQTITSTQVINSGINVTYRAGNSITLSPLTGSGFSAVSGSVFKAEIGGCN